VSENFRREQIWGLMGIALLVYGLVALLEWQVTPLKFSENWLRDKRIELLTPPRESQSDSVIVLTITEDTLATFPYRSPLDRGAIADVIALLGAAGAKGVALDILFDQPTESAKDLKLIQTMAASSIPLIAAWGDVSSGLTKAQRAYLTEFHKAAKLTPGFAKLEIDGDGKIRRMPEVKEDQPVPTGLAATLFQAALGEPRRQSEAIDYRQGTAEGEPPFKTFPLHTVKFLPKAWFSGKYVFIGADLPLIDRHPTPVSTSLPGVLIHAHILDQMVEGRSLAVSPPALKTAILVLSILIGAGIAALQMPFLGKASLLIVITCFFWAGGFAFYYNGGPLVPLLSPTLALGLTFGGVSTSLSRHYRQQQKFITSAFSKYVSPEVVQTLAADPDSLSLNGQKREMTLIFTDIAGFTTLSEQVEPEQLMGALNEYLDGMSRIVIKHDGTIDKFIGDALFSFFNAPVAQDDHAERAISCALEMDEFAEKFRKKQNAADLPMGITRIGVHTGEAIVGNVGGETRFDYTAIGDTVNTAARLEGVNKYLGTRICVSAATVALCGDIAVREVGALVVKGKSEGVTVFEPLPPQRMDSEPIKAYLEAFEKLRKEEPEAQQLFEQARKISPDDPLTHFHLTRMQNGETGTRIVMKGK